MKGIGKVVNDCTKELSIKLSNKCYTAELSKKMSSSYYILLPRKNKIRFNEKYIRENKLSGDALRNFITGCCEELFSRKQQGLDEISYEEQSHQSKICDC